MNWSKVFDQFKQAKVLVIGDVILDTYIYGKVSRISPEAPVPIVHARTTESRLGGAANVGLNLSALGAKVTLAGFIGTDEFGQKVLELCKKEGLKSHLLNEIPNRPTTVKQRIISGGQHMLRVDYEEDQPFKKEQYDKLFSEIEKELSTYDAVLFEDYDKGVLEPTFIASLIRLAKKQKVLVTVDPKKRNFLSYSEADLYKPNLKELLEGLNIELDTTDTKKLPGLIQQNFEHLIKSMPVERLLLTLSEKGVAISSKMGTKRIPAHKREISDVSGAGDTVIAVATLCLIQQLPDGQIAELANLAGGLVCQHVGVVPIDSGELLQEADRLGLPG